MNHLKNIIKDGVENYLKETALNAIENEDGDIEKEMFAGKCIVYEVSNGVFKYSNSVGVGNTYEEALEDLKKCSEKKAIDYVGHRKEIYAKDFYQFFSVFKNIVEKCLVSNRNRNINFKIVFGRTSLEEKIDDSFLPRNFGIITLNCETGRQNHRPYKRKIFSTGFVSNKNNKTKIVIGNFSRSVKTDVLKENGEVFDDIIKGLAVKVYSEEMKLEDLTVCDIFDSLEAYQMQRKW